MVQFTSYSSPVPAGKENLGGDALAGDVARKTVAVESSQMRTQGATYKSSRATWKSVQSQRRAKAMN